MQIGSQNNINKKVTFLIHLSIIIIILLLTLRFLGLLYKKSNHIFFAKEIKHETKTTIKNKYSEEGTYLSSRRFDFERDQFSSKVVYHHIMQL